MGETKSRTITIGSALKDSELVKQILRYQEENKLSSGAEAVRDLCKYALSVKNVK
ncbi:MAG: hypothetical protein LUC19_03220 [Oscillospiraceae bacterium]|nr:hypothetical protein [Oscillospiraceae bacterium]